MGWAKCKLSDVCQFESGFAFKSESYKKEGVPLIRISNIKDGTITTDGGVCIQEVVESRFHVVKGDLLIALSGATTGKMGVYDKDDDALLNQRVGNLRVISKTCFLPEYRNLFMESQTATILEQAWGGAQPNISPNTIIGFDILLPPYAEQCRIVCKANELLALVSNIEFVQDQIETGVDDIITKVLDLAIHGKLVSQDPFDEPAINLLRRINPDFKASDNLHYEGELPNGWCFSTIGDLFRHNTGKALNGKDQVGEELRYITTSNLYWDRFDLNEVRTMPFTEAEKEKCRATKGDLLVCEGGDVGRAAIWPHDFDVMIQNHIHRLRPREDISVRFYYYIFLLYKQMGLIGGKGIAILGLSSRELDKMVVPMPPVPEQHRIVTVIENLFAQMDGCSNQQPLVATR
jgi:type I restriction enzyme S subunit